MTTTNPQRFHERLEELGSMGWREGEECGAWRLAASEADRAAIEAVAALDDAGVIFSASHNPDEATAPEHLEAGAQVLLDTVVALAR